MANGGDVVGHRKPTVDCDAEVIQSQFNLNHDLDLTPLKQWHWFDFNDTMLQSDP